MWGLLGVLGGLLLWKGYRARSGIPGYERVASAELDEAASAVVSALEASTQQSLAIGDYLARWEFVRDASGNSKRTAVLYKKV